ncbi:phosphatase PAP2 family protein [Pacificimonas sp. ICDLI1SI03]
MTARGSVSSAERLPTLPHSHTPLITRLRAFARRDSRLLVLLTVVMLAALAFLQLASEMAEGDTLALDRQILSGLRSVADPGTPIGPRWLTRAMIDVTALGGVSLLTLITMGSALYLLVTRRAATALYTVFAVVAGAMSSAFLKDIFIRARPDVVPHLVEVSSASFPSGHAMNSAIVYLTLGAIIAGTHARFIERIYILSAAIALTLLIGISRVWLGVHYPSDVLAGWSVGAALAALFSLGAYILRRRHAIDPPEA